MMPPAFHEIVSVAPEAAVTVPPNPTHEINGLFDAGVESYTTADSAESVPVDVQTAFAAVHVVVWPFVVAVDPIVTPPAVYPFAVLSSVHAALNGDASKYLCVAAYVYAVLLRAHLMVSLLMFASLFHVVVRSMGYMLAVTEIRHHPFGEFSA
jgi:hypothetical protein